MPSSLEASFFRQFDLQFEVGRPWLVLGPGRDFAKREEIPPYKFYRFGVGAVGRMCERYDLGLILDYEVVQDLGKRIFEAYRYVVMPWHPLVKYAPSERDLTHYIRENPLLQELAANGRLWWFNLAAVGLEPYGHQEDVMETHRIEIEGTVKEHEYVKIKGCDHLVEMEGSPAEVAIGLLGLAGVKVIRTIGLYDSKKMAKEFRDLRIVQASEEKVEALISMHGLNFGKALDPQAQSRLPVLQQPQKRGPSPYDSPLDLLGRPREGLHPPGP